MVDPVAHTPAAPSLCGISDWSVCPELGIPCTAADGRDHGVGPQTNSWMGMEGEQGLLQLMKILIQNFLY